MSPLQRHFLERIIEQFPKRVEAVEQLSKLLNIGRDAVYRRLRGDTLLTPDELSLLAKHFKLSLDAFIFNEPNAVFFTFNAFSESITKVSDFLSGVRGDLEKASLLPEVKVYYASSEIPFFYYNFFPELVSFKLYVWGRSIWNLEYLYQIPYRFGLLQPHSLEDSKALLSLYSHLETIELWSVNLFDNTLSQIEYHLNSGQFAVPEEALILCDNLKELADHMREMAKHGKKFGLKSDPDLGTPFKLFHNEMIYTNNTIFVVSPVKRIIYSMFANPNYMRSTNSHICDFMETWFKNVISKSNSISEQAERNRDWFFNFLKRRIDNTRRRVENILKEGY